LTDLNRGSTKTVLREDGTNGSTLIQLKNSQILSIGFANARTGRAYGDARNRQ
jgi:hypothetical protein